MRDQEFLSPSFKTGALTIGTSPVQAFEGLGHTLLQGIQLLSTTGNVYIGFDGTLTSDNGYLLVQNDSIYLRISSLTGIYLVADSGEQEVRYLYL